MKKPELFSLQKIIEITYYNMSRIRIVWTRIWRILSDFFITAGTHSKQQVSLYAIDSLRQLSMRFLEKDELALYQYQRQFLRPFYHIMTRNKAPEVRELVVQCLSRMVLARSHNVKSGWGSVFLILQAGASDPHYGLVVHTFSLVRTIMTRFFAVLSETISSMDECLQCLEAFVNNKFTDCALEALEYILECGRFLGAEREKETRAMEASLDFSSSPTGSPNTSPRSLPRRPLSPAKSKSGSQSGADAWSTKSTTSDDSSGAVKSTLRHWSSIWSSLAIYTHDSRVEVRSRSVQILFSLLHNYGHLYSPSVWTYVFSDILLIIFDVKHVAATTNKRTNSTTGPNAALREQSQLEVIKSGLLPSASDPTDIRNGKRGATPKPAGGAIGTTTRAGKERRNDLTTMESDTHFIGHVDVEMAETTVNADWLHTTAEAIFATLVQLITVFPGPLLPNLQELLETIEMLIVHDEADISEFGVKAWARCLAGVGRFLEGPQWEMVLKRTASIGFGLLPHDLLSPVMRRALHVGEFSATGIRECGLISCS